MGFEPTTFCLEGRRSTRLSYHRAVFDFTGYLGIMQYDVLPSVIPYARNARQ